jgi:hypothetical protein
MVPVGWLKIEPNISSLMYVELFITKMAIERRSTWEVKLNTGFLGFKT